MTKNPTLMQLLRSFYKPVWTILRDTAFDINGLRCYYYTVVCINKGRQTFRGSHGVLESALADFFVRSTNM